jgi:hypothetical protein
LKLRSRTHCGARIADARARINGRRRRQGKRQSGRRVGFAFECVCHGSSGRWRRLHTWRWRWRRRGRWRGTRCSRRSANCRHHRSGRLGNGIVLGDRVSRCSLGRSAGWILWRWGLLCFFRCRRGRLGDHHCGVRRRCRRRISGRGLTHRRRRRRRNSFHRMVLGWGERRRRSCRRWFHRHRGRRRNRGIRSFRRQARRLPKGRRRARERRAAGRGAPQVPEDEGRMQERQRDQQPDDGDVDAARHRE